MSESAQQSLPDPAPDVVKLSQLRAGNSYRSGSYADTRISSRPSNAYPANRTPSPGSGGWSSPPAPLSEPVSKEEHVQVLRQLLSNATASSAEIKQLDLSEAASHVKLHDFDTGSTPVQLLRLSSRIKQLKNHLATHKKDHVTARSLNALEEQRYSLLAYLKRTQATKYQSVLEQCFTPKELRILANDKWRKYLG
jgi:small subunit ribosomal protein S15